ncbi:hypothetical protein BH10PLA1_BH10PLA1_01940 [soil metagenome]
MLPSSRVATLVRLAAILAIIAGLIGTLNWLECEGDMSDGDGLRYPHGIDMPYVNIRHFPEAWLQSTVRILGVCSMLEWIGGIGMLRRIRFARQMVVWQAKVSVVINTVMVLFVVSFVFIWNQQNGWGKTLPTTAAMRAITLATDLLLWIYLSREDVQHFINSSIHAPGGFPMLSREQST